MNQPEETSTTTAVEALAASALSPNEAQHQLSLEEEKFMSEKSQRLRNEAESLDDLCQQLQAQSKRIRDEAKLAEEKSKRLRTTNEFDDLCIRLRRNDPSITSISTSNFPCGYAQPLGHALRQNTHVTSICVRVGELIPSAESHNMLSDEAAIARYVDPLVQYLQTSTVLRSAELRMSHRDAKVSKQLVNLLLGACLHTVEILDLNLSCDFPIQAFQPCRPATRVKELSIQFFKSIGFSDQDHQAIAGAFRSFPSLTSLEFETSDGNLAEAILEGVQRRDEGSCTPLENLSISLEDDEPTPGFWPRMQAIVHLPVPQFKRLRLSGFDFYDAVVMQGFINVLKRPNTNSTWATAISELVLDDCRFDREEKQMLLDFMRTRLGQPSTESRGASLKKVELGFIVPFCSDLSSAFLIKMLCMGHDADDNPSQTDKEQEWYPTIGSQIESLTLHPLSEHFSSFLSRLSKNASKIRLKELVLWQLVRQEHANALATCVARIPSLQTVKVDCMTVSARRVLVALRENTTLQSVSIDTTVAPEVTSRLARAYSERNQFIEPLLLEATECLENSEPTKEGVAAMGDDPVEPNKRHLCLTLLQSAADIPVTQSATVIRSLIRLDESIGRP